MRRARFENVVEEVYEPLQRYLRRRCAHTDADEVLNDTLLVIWRRVADAPTIPLPWCYGVARRCLANHRRAAMRRLRLVDRLLLVDAPRAAWDLQDAALHEALAELDELDREVVRLWAWEHLEPREIAEVIGASSNAVSARLTRARKKLEARLIRKDHAPAGHKPGNGHEEER